MIKSKKSIIIILGVIAALTAALAVSFMIPKDESITSSDNNEIILYYKQGLVPEYFSVKNASGEYELLGFIFNDSQYTDAGSESSAENSHTMPDGTDVVYTMQDHYTYKLDKEITDQLVSQAQSLSAKQIIDKSGSRYGEFGLDEPKYSYSVRYSDAEEIKIDIGNYAPDNEGIYVKKNNDENVYLVDAASIDSFFIEKLQLFDKRITGTIDEVHSLSLSGRAYSEFINLVKNTFGCYPSKFITDDEKRDCCNDNASKMICEDIQSLYGEKVAAIDVTKDDLAQFGLDKPYQKIVLLGKSSGSITLLTSAEDESGSFYVMAQNAKTVYTISSKNAAWYSLTSAELLDSSVFKVVDSEVKQLKTTIGKEEKTITIDRVKKTGPNYYENEFITVKYGDKELLYTNISIFLNDLSKLERTNEAPESLDDFKQTLLEVEFGYYNYPELTDTVKIMRSSSGKTAAVVNGEIECFVSSEEADKIVSQAKQITSSERISSAFD